MKERLLKVIKEYVSTMLKLDPNKEWEGQCWIQEVEYDTIFSIKLINFIESQMYYWYPKDREYGQYLEKLIGGKVK